MKRICLVVVGLFINLLGAFSQVNDSAVYRPRKLSVEEIHFVSSYYHQEGNNSAVTGGTGTEKLTDYSNSFEVKMLKYNKRNRKVELEANLGIDYYTSASSDKIDPSTVSSASSRDLRIYPSVTGKIINESDGSSVSAGLSYSHESDYRSFGTGAGFSQKSEDRSREFSVKGQFYFDQVKIILPYEMRTPATGGLWGAPNQYRYPWRSRKTLSTSFSLSQVVNQRLQLMWLLDLAYQHGYLGLPFHRVYLKNGGLTNERLPSSRLKVPAGMRINYFAGDKLVLRSFYRFYLDDWGLKAHTAEAEVSVKLNPFFSITPFYRYYTQTGIDYFAGNGEHYSNEKFYSSNYDLSKFNSHFFGAGWRFAPSKGLFGKKHWNMIEVRYGHYRRSTGLHANIISLHLKYK